MLKGFVVICLVELKETYGQSRYPGHWAMESSRKGLLGFD